jgi:hypothetical protein
MKTPRMYYTDTTAGSAFAKDPDVIRFGDRYLMYYTIRTADCLAIGIAAGDDLDQWERVGEVLPETEIERKGVVAPAALVHGGRVHLFYASYGTGRRDAICHAVSEDGLSFQRDPSNPIFRPEGDWTCGRAIDADIIRHGDSWLLYAATRDPEMRVQMLTAAVAAGDCRFGRGCWTQVADEPILRPELDWERECIEAPTVCKRAGILYMFYAGAYNNEPQQIGVAASSDGVRWLRLSDRPLLPNGSPGTWNASESGHPGVFVDADGRTHLFFQGNCTDGDDWYLSRMSVGWDDGLPFLVRPRDGKQFHLQNPNTDALEAPS